MPNGEIKEVDARFKIMRCIQVKDQEHLLTIAKLLGINAKKFSELEVGNIYIAQDAQTQHPAIPGDKHATNKLAPHAKS